MSLLSTLSHTVAGPVTSPPSSSAVASDTSGVTDDNCDRTTSRSCSPSSVETVNVSPSLVLGTNTVPGSFRAWASASSIPAETSATCCTSALMTCSVSDHGSSSVATGYNGAAVEIPAVSANSSVTLATSAVSDASTCVSCA